MQVPELNGATEGLIQPHQNGDATKPKSKNVAILALGKANPSYMTSQPDYIDFIIRSLNIDGEARKSLERLGKSSGIENRYFCLNDACAEKSDWKLLPQDFPQTVPSMTDRNKVYCEQAPKLAIESSRKAVEEWGGNVDDITHIISVSCTGVMAPGSEFYVMEALGLKRSVQRLGINNMGCFGAFRGIAAAKALAKENPKNRVLLVCVEICSIHFQVEMSLETVIGNALFGDGSAAVVIGAQPKENEHVLWDIEDTHSYILEHTPKEMTWEASDHGFLMKLSAKIPQSIRSGAPEFAKNILGDRCTPSECSWAIHPGGAAIVKGLEDVLKLQKWQTQCSWNVLRDFGNMSSVTFLFVLDELRKNKPEESNNTPWLAGMGFGPGLALEGVLLKWPSAQ